MGKFSRYWKLNYLPKGSESMDLQREPTITTLLNQCIHNYILHICTSQSLVSPIIKEISFTTGEFQCVIAQPIKMQFWRVLPNYT